MPVERWSENVVVSHLGDDPQFSDEMLSIEEMLASVGSDVVLDFASVRYVNSSNLARLLKLRKSMIQAQRRLVLCSVTTQVWGTMLVTGLDKVFEFSDNVPTALATLQMA